MKNLLVVTLLLLLSFSCTDISNEEIPIIPKFKVGQSFDYEIINTSSNNGLFNYKQIKKISITVEKVEDTVATLNWTINNIEFIDSSEVNDFNALIMKIQEGITINYDVNVKGQIQQIKNYDSIQKTLDYRFENIFKINSEKEIENGGYKNSSGYGIMKAMINDNPEQNIFISDIYHFNRLNGIEFSKGLSQYYYEPWVGKTQDKYKITIDKILDGKLILKSELIDGAGKTKNNRVINREYSFNDTNYWLTNFSSKMKTNNMESMMMIKQSIKTPVANKPQ